MFRPPLCLLLLTIPSCIFAQSNGDDTPTVGLSGGGIFLPRAASVCSTIATTIDNDVDYIPVPCADKVHASISSEGVTVNKTTAEFIIAPSGNVRFVSETWFGADPRTPASSKSAHSKTATANFTSSVFSRTSSSSYVSPGSSSAMRTSSANSR